MLFNKYKSLNFIEALVALEVFRNVIFLLCAFALYGAAFYFAFNDIFPKAQTVFWKFGHVCAALHLGYWADRILFRHRICDQSPPEHHIRRAIMVVGITLSASLGL
jgi:hypothetical protein